jgi:hypothetical protein
MLVAMPRTLFVAVLVFALVPVALAAGPRNAEQVRFNRADQAAARAAVLRKADLGSGWGGGRTKPDTSAKMSCPGYEPKQSDLVLTGAAETVWGRSGIELQSLAQVLRTPAMVARDWQRTVVDRRAITCLRTTLAKGLTSSERLVSFRQAAFPRLARYSRLYRAVIEVHAQGQKVRVFADFVLVGRRRTELTLSVTAPNALRATVSRAEVKWARAMLGRARA